MSFAIARLRREDEPESAAWDYMGTHYVEVEAYTQPSDECGEDSGCEKGFGIRDAEHIAGPGCIATGGYSDHRISMEEMKGCRAVQALMKKTPEWQPEHDDQDFELESGYFLTGVGDGSPDTAPLEPIQPARHGFDSVWISNVNGYVDDVRTACISPRDPTDKTNTTL